MPDESAFVVKNNGLFLADVVSGQSLVQAHLNRF